MKNEQNTKGQQMSTVNTEVTITNAYRHCPIVFSVPGRSIRLGPLESCKIERHRLKSPELSALIRSGVVHVQERPSPKASAAEAGTSGDHGKPTEGPRSDKEAHGTDKERPEKEATAPGKKKHDKPK